MSSPSPSPERTDGPTPDEVAGAYSALRAGAQRRREAEARAAARARIDADQAAKTAAS